MSTALPLTGAQAGVWYAQQVEPDGTAFNVATYLDIRGPVDLDRLAAAVAGDASPRRSACTCASTVSPTLPGSTSFRRARSPCRWWTSAPHDDPEAAALAWAFEDRARPMDLAHRPAVPARAAAPRRPPRASGTSDTTTSSSTAIGITLLARRAAERYETTELSEVDWELARLTDGRRDATGRATGSAWTRRTGSTGWVTRRSRFGCWTGRASRPPGIERRRSTVDTDGAAGVRRAGRGAAVAACWSPRAAGYVQRVTGADEVVLGLPVTGRSGARPSGRSPAWRRTCCRCGCRGGTR